MSAVSIIQSNLSAVEPAAASIIQSKMSSPPQVETAAASSVKSKMTSFLCADPEDDKDDGEQNNNVCKCTDPGRPSSFPEKLWKDHHKRLVQQAQTATPFSLVILGDSITERINGTKGLGRKQLRSNQHLFGSLFSKKGGGSLDALALGTGGDTSSNLLWHLENGMLPDTLQPDVWMILIGTNDMGRMGCSKQSTLQGILQVIAYMQRKRPSAKILLHGLLPRSDITMQKKMKKKDYLTGKDWEKIQWINEHLKNACTNDLKNCAYMEASDIFLSSARGSVNPVTLFDGLHPSLAGLQKWEPMIVDTVKALLNNE